VCGGRLERQVAQFIDDQQLGLCQLQQFLLELLYGSLKVGRLHGRRFRTRRDATDEIVDWLMFYNHRRLHSSLGYVSPMQFERAWLAAQNRQAA